jgi:hypothetical protein
MLFMPPSGIVRARLGSRCDDGKRSREPRVKQRISIASRNKLAYDLLTVRFNMS